MTATLALDTAGGYIGGLDIPGWELFYKGKVRDLYRHPNHPDQLLMIATDRLSAFDVVMAETIPDRGKILTFITEHWLKEVSDWMPAARITCEPSKVPDLPSEVHDVLRGRMTWTHTADRVNVEIVLRAHLAGSGYREYRDTGKLWDIEVPEGLQNSSKLPEVVLTPTTKAEKDEPITWMEAVAEIGDLAQADRIRELAFRMFQEAATRANSRGVILADTKFEFGRLDGELVVIDEVLTPDSSRYWPADQIVAGKEPPSYDKEIVRQFLRTVDNWDFKAPPPTIPADVIAQTRDRYLEICQILCGALPEGLAV
ncbi:MAG: phosphoribosylaminoimidazolesuccinocarboxamide synthase [Planctomycetes bacterium]|nr:phosphoribosylaminoimidazolesuccinocarboxamide synthase [Planctomycetota bacterium]MBT4028431.1 phosphoribosylaminoimidazolesuccinocarboxamide synthase [Planctomycetota bacterium]MBT4559698.1 phosphoribosylaminoimidazolesuccinocarboxamide synthase [Planctomycetota bacterium]MBT5120901.1 phosphoribosylaminoimidazolesuccinocarboxamide synthase [Planctomycetota bacterium]MBT7319484.1 phosphoribosylaminoimidazolesuccinocarboxamide synthase [Planctomycetota bacterium]